MKYFFAYPGATGEQIIDEDIPLSAAKERLAAEMGIKPSDFTMFTVEQQLSTEQVIKAHQRAYNSLVGSENPELWPIKLDAAKTVLAAAPVTEDGVTNSKDENARAILAVLLTTQELAAAKNDKDKAVRTLAQKIIDRSTATNIKLMQLDGMKRRFDKAWAIAPIKTQQALIKAATAEINAIDIEATSAAEDAAK